MAAAALDRGRARRACSRACGRCRRSGSRSTAAAGPRARGGRRRAASTCRRFASSAMDGFAVRAADARARCPSSSGSLRAGPPTGRSRRARRWGSPRAAPFPRAPTRSCRSSVLSKKTTASRSRIPSARGSRPAGRRGRSRGGAAAPCGHAARRRAGRRPCRRRGRGGRVLTAADRRRAQHRHRAAPPGEPLGPGQIYESN